MSTGLDGLDAETGRWGKRGTMEGGGGVAFKERESLGFGGKGGGHGCHLISLQRQRV